MKMFGCNDDDKMSGFNNDKGSPVYKNPVKLKDFLVQFDFWSDPYTGYLELHWLRILSNTTHQAIFELVGSFRVGPHTQLLKREFS